MDEVLKASDSAENLYIDTGSLPNGHTYRFHAEIKATLTSGSEISGHSYIDITVEKTPLIASLNRQSGSHSPNQDLVLRADNSNDPDALEGTALSYFWQCEYFITGEECIDDEGDNLISASDTLSSLTIQAERLASGVSYDFTLTVSKDSRSSSVTISIEVLSFESETSVENILLTSS